MSSPPLRLPAFDTPYRGGLAPPDEHSHFTMLFDDSPRRRVPDDPLLPAVAAAFDATPSRPPTPVTPRLDCELKGARPARESATAKDADERVSAMAAPVCPQVIANPHPWSCEATHYDTDKEGSEAVLSPELRVELGRLAHLIKEAVRVNAGFNGISSHRAIKQEELAPDQCRVQCAMSKFMHEAVPEATVEVKIAVGYNHSGLFLSYQLTATRKPEGLQTAQ